MIDHGNFFRIHIDRFRSRMRMWRAGPSDQAKCRGSMIDGTMFDKPCMYMYVCNIYL